MTDKERETLENNGALYPKPDEQTELLRAIGYYMRELVLIMDEIKRKL